MKSNRLKTQPSHNPKYQDLGNKKAYWGNPSKPYGGQSEIRTRGGLHLNGFQDRLFRPLRHLPVHLSHKTSI